MAKKVIKTCCVTLAYCLVWMALERLIYGQVTSRIVDDIMMLLFIPIVWKAVDNTVKIRD